MRSLRKLVAVVIMLWLPLFSGNALAWSVTMQIPASHCHDEAMASISDMGMSDMDMEQQPASTDNQNFSCDTCGICHLACSGYVTSAEAVPESLNMLGLVQPSDKVSFRSITFAPLVPPPLVRA